MLFGVGIITDMVHDGGAQVCFWTSTTYAMTAF
jgi:hypothetical protein